MMEYTANNISDIDRFIIMIFWADIAWKNSLWKITKEFAEIAPKHMTQIHDLKMILSSKFSQLVNTSYILTTQVCTTLAMQHVLW
jgi:hypothetical protein